MSKQASISQEESPSAVSAEKKQQSKQIYLQAKASDELQVQAPEGYQFVKTIGDGSFGKVKLGVHKLTGEKVAIKILCKDRIKEKTDIERISREIKIMKAIKHPFVVQMYEIIESPKQLFLIMEYVEGGDLFDAISQASKLSEEIARTYFIQIILGLEYLHSVGIAHRDMKPENILIGEYGKCKIADFGLGNFFTEGQTLKTACGSPCYAPPEMLNQQQYNPRKVDIWSSGIILYAMVHGYLPFEDEVQSVLYEKIRTKNIRIASSISIPCRNLIRGLLIKDPNERWDTATIKNHEFLCDFLKPEQEYISLETADLNVDEFKQICQHLGILEEDQNRLFNSIRKNKHNNLTTLYYLGKKHMLRQLVEEKSMKQDKEIHKDEVFDRIEIESLQRKPFSFFQHKEVQQDVVSKIQPKQQGQIQQMKKEESIQRHQESIQSFDALTLQSVNSLPLPRQPPEQFVLSSPSNLKQQAPTTTKAQTAKLGEDSKEKPSQNAKVPARPSSHSFATSKVAKKQIQPKKQDIKTKIQSKGQLKKSQRVIMYKPKDQHSRVHEGEVKLYQRSHSKDRPIVLKNNFKSDKVSIKDKKDEQCHVIFKVVHMEPHIIDVQRIALCSGPKLCQLLSKKGYSGKLEYFNYSKDCIFVTKCQLKPMKPGVKYLGHELEKTIIQINQSSGQ